MPNDTVTITVISTLVIAIFTAGLAVITYFYLRETKKIREVNQEMLKASNMPKIKVALLYSHRDVTSFTIDLYIQNIGTGYAYNIAFDGDFKEYHPDITVNCLGEYEIIKHGISHLGPGRRFQTPVKWIQRNTGGTVEKLPSDKKKILVTYEDSAGNPYNEEYDFDFNRVEGFIEMGDPIMDNIAVSLRNIYKIMKKRDRKHHQETERITRCGACFCGLFRSFAYATSAVCFSLVLCGRGFATLHHTHRHYAIASFGASHCTCKSHRQTTQRVSLYTSHATQTSYAAIGGYTSQATHTKACFCRSVLPLVETETPIRTH